MTDEVMRATVKKCLDYKADYYTVCFQGGEPTLAGIGFFRNFITCFDKNNILSAKVKYSIQTNGIILDDKWAEFFLQNDFFVGLSLDGLVDTHDRNRVDKFNNGTHLSVMRAARLLESFGIDFNILTVVTRSVAENIGKIYEFFKNNDLRNLQFIPCIDSFDTKQNFSDRLDAETYQKFLIEVYRLWQDDYLRQDYVSIRHIDNYIGILCGYKSESCALGYGCGTYFVVEGDGGVYPCDFYCTNEFLLGNVSDKSFTFDRPAEKHRTFCDSVRPAEKCFLCKYYKLCLGGCRRDKRENLETVKYCESYIGFFDECIASMKAVAEKVIV